MKDQKKDSFYIPLDLSASINEHEEGIQGGETSRVADLDKTFQWMRGNLNGWYGWANDGKGTFLDYLMVLKAKYDNWKFCCFKPEDMDTIRVKRSGKLEVEIKANMIYKNFAWTLTGKTWIKNFSEKHNIKRMTLDEENEALEFVRKHFFIIYPHEREYTSMLDNCKWMYDKHGIDSFLWDPFNEIEIDYNKRADQVLSKVFSDCKTFSMKTNSVFNIVSHPRTINDVKEKDGSFKVVTQFHQLGGFMWDNKMDAQFSIHRPFRHLAPTDAKVKKVHLYNLKQKKAEAVGAHRGVYKEIDFDPIRRQYYFDGLNPVDGSMTEEKRKAMAGEPVVPGTDIFTEMITKKNKKEIGPKNPTEPKKADDDLPF